MIDYIKGTHILNVMLNMSSTLYNYTKYFTYGLNKKKNSNIKCHQKFDI